MEKKFVMLFVLGLFALACLVYAQDSRTAVATTRTTVDSTSSRTAVNITAAVNNYPDPLDVARGIYVSGNTGSARTATDQVSESNPQPMPGPTLDVPKDLVGESNPQPMPGPTLDVPKDLVGESNPQPTPSPQNPSMEAQRTQFLRTASPSALKAFENDTFSKQMKKTNFIPQANMEYSGTLRPSEINSVYYRQVVDNGAARYEVYLGVSPEYSNVIQFSKAEEDLYADYGILSTLRLHFDSYEEAQSTMKLMLEYLPYYKKYYSGKQSLFGMGLEVPKDQFGTVLSIYFNTANCEFYPDLDGKTKLYECTVEIGKESKDEFSFGGSLLLD